MTWLVMVVGVLVAMVGDQIDKKCYRLDPSRVCAHPPRFWGKKYELGFFLMGFSDFFDHSTEDTHEKTNKI